jgi:hypothetical protein
VFDLSARAKSVMSNGDVAPRKSLDGLEISGKFYQFKFDWFFKDLVSHVEVKNIFVKMFIFKSARQD